MKIVIRIFNFIIMALAAAATVFLFISPTLSFNSRIALDVTTFSQFVPETKYSDQFKIDELLGTDTIYLSVKFTLKPQEVQHIMDGNRDKINESIVSDNVDGMLETLHTTVDLITDFSVRFIIKSIVAEQVTKQIDDARENYQQKSGKELPPTETIKKETGIDDEYFTTFAFALYDSMNTDDATVDSVTETLYAQIDEALIKVENYVDSSSYNDEAKQAISESLLSSLNELKLVEEGGKVKKISQISYMYLSDYLKKELEGKNVSESLEQKAGESTPDYADRLLRIYVFTQMPDVFYTGVGYVSLGLFIGLFVFAFIWGFLFIWTLIRTFTKKPWTFFGPIYWIIGLLQVVLGLGLTVAGKIILPKYFDVATLGLPIKELLIAPRTYALIPSMLYLGSIILAIIYLCIKIPAKHQYKNENRNINNNNNNNNTGMGGGLRKNEEAR